MIKFDNQGLTIHDKLDKTEATIFCKFLIAEKRRHTEDIRMIESSINYLENKFNFKADEI